MKIQTILASMIIASSAMAAELPYFFFQPKGHTSSLELAYNTLNLSGTVQGTTITAAASGIPFSYSYGINDGNAIGISNSSTTLSVAIGSTTLKNTGLGDWVIGYKGNASNLYYGVNAMLFSAVHKSPTASVDGNNTQGGTSAEPYFGMNFGPFGFKLAYNYLMDRKIDAAPNADSTQKDGNATKATAYYEFNMSNTQMDVYLNFGQYASSTTTTAAGSPTQNAAYNDTSFGFKGIYELSKTAGITWDVTYGSLAYASTNVTPAYTISGFGAGLGARFDF